MATDSFVTPTSRAGGLFESVTEDEVEPYFWQYYGVDPKASGRNPQAVLDEYVDVLVNFLQPRGRVLSVGCGHGVVEVLLAMRSPHIQKIIGLDLRDPHGRSGKLQTFRTLARKMAVAGTSAVLGNGGRQPFRDATFDAVMLIECLSHADFAAPNADLLGNQRWMVEEASRVLRPGGTLLLMDFNNGMSPLVLANSRRQPDEHPINPYYWRAFLESAGYERTAILPYAQVGARRNLRGLVTTAMVRASPFLGLLVTNGFMLRAQKGM